MASMSHIFPTHSTSSPIQLNNTFTAAADTSTAPSDASEAPSLLVSILPHRLQFLSIQKPAVPSLCYALLRLLLEAQDRNSFLSYTETDDKDVSLLLDASLLAEFRASLSHLPNLAIAPPTAAAAAGGGGSAAAIQLIGYPLRAIQVLEGYSGHVDTAIIATVSTALADAGFSIFYVSTNHADYVLVREEALAAVLGCLADRFVLIKDEMEGDDEDEDEDGSQAAHQHEEERKEAEADSGTVIGREREVMKASSAPASTSLLSPDSAHSDWSEEVRKSPRRDRRRHDTSSESSEDEERMIREAMRRSKRNRHRRTEEREGIAEEEESEQEEWSQASRTPPSAFLGSTPLDPSPAMALSSLSLATTASFSSTPAPISTNPAPSSTTSSTTYSSRPLRLQAMPYSLILHSFIHSDMPTYFSALLQLIFFPTRSFASPTHSSPSSTASPHLNARFFSFTMIDHDYSLITTPPSTPSAAFPATLLQSLQSSQQWSVIEALGVFRYDESGLVSRVSRPLSGAGLRFFYFSSWRTGFVIVHKEDLAAACMALDAQQGENATAR